MTPEEANARAQAYVDRVLQSQRDLGHESKLTDEEYQRAVDRAAKALADVAEPEDAPEHDGEPVPA
jgi:hypothetical protein